MLFSQSDKLTFSILVKKASVYVYMTWHAHLINKSFIWKCFMLKEKIILKLFNDIWTSDSVHNYPFALHFFWITQPVHNSLHIYHVWFSLAFWIHMSSLPSCLQSSISIPKWMLPRARKHSPVLVIPWLSLHSYFASRLPTILLCKSRLVGGMKFPFSAFSP